MFAELIRPVRGTAAPNSSCLSPTVGTVRKDKQVFEGGVMRIRLRNAACFSLSLSLSLAIASVVCLSVGLTAEAASPPDSVLKIHHPINQSFNLQSVVTGSDTVVLSTDGNTCWSVRRPTSRSVSMQFAVVGNENVLTVVESYSDCAFQCSPVTPDKWTDLETGNCNAACGATACGCQSCVMVCGQTILDIIKEWWPFD